MPYSLRFAVTPLSQHQATLAGTLPGQQTGQGNQPSGNQASQPSQRETIYVTMSTKDPERHFHLGDIGHAVMTCLAVALLLVFVLVPVAPRYTTKTLSVPVRLLPVQTITVSVPVMATGVKTYPATQAQGVLTITNGGSLTEYLQSGFIVTAANGVEVVTDQAITIPPGNGANYGVATVSAHVVMAGSSGNLPAGSINRTYGTDVFIRNMAAFTGGRDAYSVRYVTNQDTQTALASARARINAKRPLGLQLKPCMETTSQQASSVSATLSCQPITYQVPAGLQIVGVQIVGMRVVVSYKAVVDADT